MVCALNVNRYKPLAINRMKPLTHVSQAMLFTLRGQGPKNGVSGLASVLLQVLQFSDEHLRVPRGSRTVHVY